MPPLLQALIDNYDLSDIIDQSIILMLVILLLVRLPRIRFRRRVYY